MHRAPARHRGWAWLGLSLSAVLAAATIVIWVSWRVPTKVTLAPPPEHDRSVAASAPTDPTTPTTSRPGRPRPTRRTTARPPSTTITAEASGPTAPPVSVSIPSLGITGPVVPESLGAGGTLIIPPPTQVGWYDGSATPGSVGTVLLAGHIDDNGVAGVFLRLNSVQVGATVGLTSSSGQTWDYRVTQRSLLPQASLSSSGLLGTTGQPKLVLVTCGGAYDEQTHLYLDNIILTATLSRS